MYHKGTLKDPTIQLWQTLLWFLEEFKLTSDVSSMPLSLPPQPLAGIVLDNRSAVGKTDFDIHSHVPEDNEEALAPASTGP